MNRQKSGEKSPLFCIGHSELFSKSCSNDEIDSNTANVKDLANMTRNIKNLINKKYCRYLI